ncbi:glycosyltransferase family 25 protein [Mesorhizobium sp.]|uniref:glycosyltransferase family 25 protein n=1 Tax=Mesorhizobium sp. TaxID=1871066 RepID=UPI0025F0CD17|nr:glycosyltransferase family 25 protein [Mesorhizobium sp.]
MRALASVPLSAGEIGCFLSHRKVWQMVAGSRDEWAFVAEDDNIFPSTPPASSARRIGFGV